MSRKVLKSDKMAQMVIFLKLQEMARNGPNVGNPGRGRRRVYAAKVAWNALEVAWRVFLKTIQKPMETKPVNAL